MMKKMLVLMLVLGMASAASATLQISVDGNLEPVSSEIFLEPSETLMLDIWTDAGLSEGSDEGYWAITVDPMQGTISGGVSTTGNTDAIWYGGPVGGYAPGEGAWMGTASVTNTYPAGTVLFDEIVFHCETEELDAVITLYRMNDFAGDVTAVDTVTIHQIPEPMTLALLGIGGLFLVRRKK